MEIHKKISDTKTGDYLIFFLILMILVFLILNYFNHPPHEDFYYAEETKRLGLLKAFKVLYKYYGGRYFTYILICLNPLVFNSIQAYKVITFLLMIIFFYVLFQFVSLTTGNGLTIREKLLFSLSIIFLYLYKMASVEEGFYWLLSTICYHFSFILIMLFFIFYIRLSNENNINKKIFYTLIGCLVASMIPGTNEFAAGLILILIFSLLIKNFFFKKTYDWILLLFAVITGIGTYFLLKAPGNYARFIENGKPLQLDNALYNTFIFFVEKVFEWVFNTPLLIITILFIPFFQRIIKNKSGIKDMFSVNPIFSLLLWVSILLINIFTKSYSTSSSPYERTENFIYFVFLIGWFYNVIVLTSYVSRKFKINIEKLPKFVYTIGFAVIIFFLFRENNIKNACIDLFGGGAYTYSNELEKRYNHILQSSSDTVEIESIKNVPKSFYSWDLIDDSSVNSDRAFANYFNKKAIIIKSQDNIDK
ncbi:MAG: DUF6056 family protein [bacterium]